MKSFIPGFFMTGLFLASGLPQAAGFTRCSAKAFIRLKRLRIATDPSSFGLWGRCGGVWYRLEEYYYDSRREGISRTDEEHYSGLESLIGDREPEYIIVDPSAASFIECIRRHGRFRVIPAKNDVLYGIRRVSDALKSRRILISADCQDCLREFSLYCWNEKSGGDIPVKENDHAMDDVRYFVTAAIDSGNTDDFFVASVAR